MLKKLARIVLLGGVMVMFTGCDRKNSREFIEGKAVELSKVYPTKDLEDLSEKFPNGFSIESQDLYDYNEKTGFSFQTIDLIVRPKSKTILGKIQQTKVSIDHEGKDHEEIIYEGNVVYENGEIRLKNPIPGISIKNPKLLIQEFSINKSFLAQLPLIRKGYSLETGSADINYKIKNHLLNKYMGVSEGEELNMIIYIMNETIEGKGYSYTLSIKNGHNSHSELIGEVK